MRTMVAMLTVCLMVACGGSDSGLQASEPPKSVPDMTPQLAYVAGTLRQNKEDRTRWEYVIDEHHGVLGVQGWHAVARGDSLRIEFAQAFRRIISFVAVPDEVFAQEGYTFGASVGLEKAVLKSNAGVLDGSDGRELHRGNIWFYGVFEL